MSDVKLRRLDEFRWEVPKEGAMRVPGIIYASERLMKAMGRDESPKQVANVAQLPGIVKHSLAMPDMHWGYGFPIGGVAAFDLDGGIISPGGVGYDINCGCRLMMTNLRAEEIRPQIEKIVNALFHHVPSGVGSKGSLKLPRSEERNVLVEGARWAVKNGYGTAGDLESMEDGGCLAGADPEAVSERALERGKDQVGTLGSGNHFLEVEIVEEIFDRDAASALGIEVGQVAVMIHSGSRGLGHQVCDDYLAKLVKHVDRLGIALPDRQLACAYIQSPEGRQYLSAMACAANYAWANRQMLMHWTGEALERVLGMSPRDLGMRLVYDVCHNIAKIEEHDVDGKKMTLCVHRKGATRAFPPGHPALAGKFRKTGQPVLIPGDMGTGSYVLVGTEKAMAETFGSTCHGAGRVLSRAAAIKASKGRAIRREMEDRGVLVMAAAKGTLAEEIPEAYKDIDEVINVVHGAGLSRKVARLKAIGCIKG
ncbi:MAG: RNA-splicing ligase RtcB [Syntrophaceae bacterium PtaU1.Bin231]|nr:MAG: RNA-splicing ligase RtcB [Syntrophaceae bacterium PtaU1.Bin231]